MTQETVNQGLTPYAGDGCAAYERIPAHEILSRYSHASGIPVGLLICHETGISNTYEVSCYKEALPNEFATVNGVDVFQSRMHDRFTVTQLEASEYRRKQLNELHKGNLSEAYENERSNQMPSNLQNVYSGFINELTQAGRDFLTINIESFCKKHNLADYAFGAMVKLCAITYVNAVGKSMVAVFPGKNSGLVSVEKLYEAVRGFEQRNGLKPSGGLLECIQTIPAPAMLHGCSVPKHPGITNPPAQYRAPFQEADDELQKAIWNVIKSWDINVPEWYEGYTGAMGNHACAIADAVRAILPAWMRRSFK